MKLRSLRFLSLKKVRGYSLVEWLHLYGETPYKNGVIPETRNGNVQQYRLRFKKKMGIAVIRITEGDDFVRCEITADNMYVKHVVTVRAESTEYDLDPQRLLVSGDRVRILSQASTTNKRTRYDVRKLALLMTTRAISRHGHPVALHAEENGDYTLLTDRPFLGEECRPDYRLEYAELEKTLCESYTKCGIPHMVTDSGVEILV